MVDAPVSGGVGGAQGTVNHVLSPCCRLGFWAVLEIVVVLSHSPVVDRSAPASPTAGTLTFMVGGEEKDFEAAKPILAVSCGSNAHLFEAVGV